MTQARSASEHKFSRIAVEEIDLEGTFSGYASLFGEIDLGRDRVERGAFARSIARRGAGGIRMLFQHDPAEPIGRWLEIREDGRGLFVRGRISQGCGRGSEVLALLRDKALDGLSIGYRTVRAKREPGTGIRRIVEADLWEISVVTFPMLPGARIGEVKRSGNAMPTVREFERWLRRDAGLSRSEARHVVARGFASLAAGRDAGAEPGERLAGLIRRAARQVTPTSRTTT